MPRRRRQSSPARSTTRRDSGRAAARQPRDGERSPGSGHVAPSSGLAPGATTAKAADAACDAAGLRSSMYPTLPRWLRSAQGLGGTSGGSFYAPPPWVDVSKAPGTTAQPLSWRDWAWKVATCRMFFYSPNVVWALIAAAVYVAFPYDFEAAASVASLPAYGARRAALNLAVCGAYYGWWSATLYGPLAWARRKFRGVPSGRPGEWKPARSPSARVVARNMWFWALGVAQYTLWEVAVVHCFATGRLGYVADDEVFASVSSCVAFALGVVLMPVWRGIHFYWAHRFTHIRPFYKYIHSLHHRNVDIEPFAGLYMHPVEHAWYFACCLPSIFLTASPYLFLFNGLHFMLSPADAHSGWEDHFHSEQFHYIHHASFEANYGTTSMPLDYLFGTFRERLGDSKAYRGAGKVDAVAVAAAITDMPQSRLQLRDVLPATPADAAYYAVCLMMGALLLKSVGVEELPLGLSPRQVAAIVAFVPVALPVALCIASGDRLPLRWPFHKEGHLTFVAHLVGGALCSCIPVYYLVAAVLLPPQQT